MPLSIVKGVFYPQQNKRWRRFKVYVKVYVIKTNVRCTDHIIELNVLIFGRKLIVQECLKLRHFTNRHFRNFNIWAWLFDPASRGFFLFLASLLAACTKSFASLVFCAVGLFTSLGEVNKPTTQSTRDANDFVHTKRLARKKPLLAG